mmetsp:Transcript_19890/g.24554  ORF Transcript_19890/g.24554 Transcript_19890/m.24554 type:complete len:242 (-) Transcript_19890:210-935(-)
MRMLTPQQLHTSNLLHRILQLPPPHPMYPRPNHHFYRHMTVRHLPHDRCRHRARIDSGRPRRLFRGRTVVTTEDEARPDAAVDSFLQLFLGPVSDGGARGGGAGTPGGVGGGFTVDDSAEDLSGTRFGDYHEGGDAVASMDDWGREFEGAGWGTGLFYFGEVVQGVGLWFFHDILLEAKGCFVSSLGVSLPLDSNCVERKGVGSVCKVQLFVNVWCNRCQCRTDYTATILIDRSKLSSIDV